MKNAAMRRLVVSVPEFPAGVRAGTDGMRGSAARYRRSEQVGRWLLDARE